MSCKQMKKFRREFRARHGRTKSLEPEVNFRNVKKVVTLSEERRILAGRLLENSRLPKAKRKSYLEIIKASPKAGDEYVKKTARIHADEVRQLYQAEKKLFRHGA